MTAATDLGTRTCSSSSAVAHRRCLGGAGVGNDRQPQCIFFAGALQTSNGILQSRTAVRRTRGASSANAATAASTVTPPRATQRARTLGSRGVRKEPFPCTRTRRRGEQRMVTRVDVAAQRRISHPLPRPRMNRPPRVSSAREAPPHATLAHDSSNGNSSGSTAAVRTLPLIFAPMKACSWLPCRTFLQADEKALRATKR